MSAVYHDRQPNTPRDVLEAHERADLNVASELSVTFARWAYPQVLSPTDAEARARDIEGLARMARKAARR